MQYTTTLSEHDAVVMSIGNFDGIHKGHQRLLHELRAMAERLECKPVVVTFSPHTLMVVRPDIYIEYLSTLDEKIALIKDYGHIDDTMVIHFTTEVAAMSAEAFMDTLRTLFTLKGLMVGENFSLGNQRKGDISFLHAYGKEHGIAIQTIGLEEAEDVRISSTRIRALVKEGNIELANELLGHPMQASGIVHHGDKRGRTIGFPTANLRPEPHKLLPANGVYAAYVRILEENTRDIVSASTVYKSAVNIGIRPTFNGKERLVEVHLLDVDMDLYDKTLVVDLIARLRGEQRFSGIEALKAQIAADTEKARKVLTIRSVSS
jgi:riboflavin kinase / FMN adenylyltransferase